MIEIIPILFALSGCELLTKELYTAPHKPKNTIQRNMEPSCALHMDDIL